MEKYKFSAEKQQMLESMTIPLAVFQYVNNKIETLVVSEGFRDMFGYETLKDTYYDMENDMYKYDHPDDIARIADAALRFAVDGGTFDIIYRTKERSGSGYRIVHAKGKHVFETPDARVSYIYYTDEGFYAKDEGNHTTDFARSLNNALHEESILKANYYDFLTGLPSMTYFFELASASKERILENGGNPALLYMDFGGMKFFNSKHGFAEGDKMLKSFAGLLKEMFGNENCCRIGSDHFAVVTEKALAEEQLETLFKKCEQMNEGKNLPLHVGIYHAQMNPVHVSAACDRARLACNALKGSYASGFNYYSQEISDSVEKKQYIVEHLDQAIAEKWIKVYYQPIVRAVNGRVCGEEALARWIDPDKGFLSPADFIPFLEEAGLIYKLDLFVLEQILEKLKNQKKAGLTAIPHSINLSRVDFDSCDIVEEIRRRVDDSGVSRSLITIEITESVIGSDFEYMKNLVDRFRANGFEVWMDDFGSGYSSLDVLQSVQFDLIKFDMSFMRKLEEGNSGKIILTELMKMATSLGLETVCEGVETESQARFLQEIGCSMLQGYYYCRPISYEQLLERYQKGEQIGYENPAEASYYEAIGQVNLYDLSVIAGNNEDSFQNSFNTLPMGIIEIQDDESRFVRCNQSYRDFIKRFFRLDLSYEGSSFTKYSESFTRNVVDTCCRRGLRAFYDDKMSDGSVVHSFARQIGINPENGNSAVAIAVLSISEPEDGTSYADIARALAADYYNIYVVDLDSENFIEYTSSVGGDELAMERHGTNFFASAKQDTMTRIFEEDREMFLNMFTKENIIQELNSQGVYTTTYRLIDTGKPIYVNMKITRMHPGGNKIIIGISIIDSQMKHKELLEEFRREQETLTRVMALTENYLSLYTVNPETDNYIEYTASDEYETLGLTKYGEDFFQQSLTDIKEAIHPADLPRFLENFSKEQIMDEIQKTGSYKLQYRLMISGKPKRVSLHIAPFKENGKVKLFAGVRAWRDRKY